MPLAQGLEKQTDVAASATTNPPTNWRWSAELVHVFRYHYAAFASTGFYNPISSDNVLFEISEPFN